MFCDKFQTRHSVVYLGYTLHFMPRSCSVGRQNGQGIAGSSPELANEISGSLDSRLVNRARRVTAG